MLGFGMPGTQPAALSAASADMAHGSRRAATEERRSSLEGATQVDPNALCEDPDIQEMVDVGAACDGSDEDYPFVAAPATSAAEDVLLAVDGSPPEDQPEAEAKSKGGRPKGAKDAKKRKRKDGGDGCNAQDPLESKCMLAFLCMSMLPPS